MKARRLIEQFHDDDKDEILAAAAQRLPGPDEVSYELTVEHEEGQPDWDRPTDNADAEAHDEMMDEIARRREMDDAWAWGQVTVTATWSVGEKVFEGHDYLGGCSYQDEDDFKRPGGYYEDMKGRAYEDLIKQLEYEFLA